MKVLIGCEFSGTVRDAFRARGHDAWSCDLLPTEVPGPHIEGDALAILDQGWDLAVFHPPCTRLANSGVRWLYTEGRGSVQNPEMWQAMLDGVEFFNALWAAPIPQIAIENPIMHRHAKARITAGEQSQIIQPFQFGDPYQKATCLWLKNLPQLVPSNIVEGREQKCWNESPSPDRWKNRSKTYQGIADAMAAQWSPLLV